MKNKKHLNVDLEFLDNEDDEIPNQANINKFSVEKEEANYVEENTMKGNSRPWPRYWARMVDMILFSIVFAIFSAMFLPNLLREGTDIFFGIICAFVWVFVESVLLSSWGTTYGKWLLNIKLRTKKDEKLKFSDALNRSFSVWLKGMGLAIPIVTIFTMGGSYNYLRDNGQTEWDEKGGYVVNQKKIGVLRIIGVVIVMFFYSLLYLYGTE